jgi:hypothetical protein
MLQPQAELAVDVVATTTGAPLAGVDVALMKAALAADSRDVPSHWYQTFREGPGTTGSGGELTVIVLARGTSDERGRVRFRTPAGLRNLVLVTGGTRCVASEHHGIELPSAGAHTTIRVTPGAVVHGTITPRAFVERFGPSPEELAEVSAKARVEWIDPDDLTDGYPRVVLEPIDGASRDHGAHMAADGSFTIGSVPAGRYAVRVSTGTGEWLGPLATAAVDPVMETPPLSLDVAAFLPARGTVQVFVDGSHAAGELDLQRLTDQGVRTIRCKTDATGRATTPWLVPGTYTPLLYPADGIQASNTDRARRRERAILAMEPLVVRAGVPFTATLSLQRRDVTVTLLDGDGRPAPERVVHGESLDHAATFPGNVLRGRTDAAGRLVLSAPPGRLRFRAFDRDQDPRVLHAGPALPLGDLAADANAVTFRIAR